MDGCKENSSAREEVLEYNCVACDAREASGAREAQDALERMEL